MSRSISRYVWLVALCVLLAGTAAAQHTSRVTLDDSETLFNVLTAIGHCGYAPEYRGELRVQVLNEVANAVANSAEAQKVSAEMCSFYRDHKQADPARDLAQYVSLALNLTNPPKFDLTVKEADLPPDASYVLGLRPLLIQFAGVVPLDKIWRAHQREYAAAIEQYHTPVTNMLLATDVYLRLPMSGYIGRLFTVYIEPMAAPGPVNARNYGEDYFLVVSPGPNTLRLEDVRHTYLHFMIDPLVARRTSAMKRMSPMLATITDAPLNDNFKRDISLLVSESLIKAIEARLTGKGKQAEPLREREVNESMAEGFVLSRYFFDNLVQFEKSDLGFQDALSEWLYNFDLDHERKVASAQRFVAKAAPDVLTSGRRQASPLDIAEQRLAAGDALSAKILAERALKDKVGDAGRAAFVLARVATLDKDINGARSYFEQTIHSTRDAHLVAWSHIYLGRIADIQANREQALSHYQAALDAGDSRPETKAAAERGLKEPYAPPRAATEKEPE